MVCTTHRWRAEHRISRWVDHGGGGPHGTPRRLRTRSRHRRRRPAKRRFTGGGSGKSVARCHRTVLAYWKFESTSLQERVSELSFPGRAHRRRQLWQRRLPCGAPEKTRGHRSSGWTGDRFLDLKRRITEMTLEKTPIVKGLTVPVRAACDQDGFCHRL